MDKCPKCNSPLVLSDYEPLCTIATMKHTAPDVKPKLDDRLHAKVECSNSKCDFEDCVEAEIIYEQFTLNGEFKQLMERFRYAYINLSNFVSDHDREFCNIFATGYPFNFSFDENIHSVDEWCDKVIKEVEAQNKAKHVHHPTVDYGRIMKMDMSKYDGVEINPCQAFVDDHEVLPWERISEANSFTRVVEDAELISCWSVYFHLKEGGVDNVADFETHEQAKECAQFLEKFVLNQVPTPDTENKQDEIIHLTNFKPVNVGDIKHIDLRSVFSIRGFTGGFNLLGNSHNKNTWVISQLDADLKYVDNMPYDNEADYLSDVAYLRKAEKGKLNEKKHVNITVSTTVAADLDEEHLRLCVDDALNNSNNFTSMTKDHDVYKHGN